MKKILLMLLSLCPQFLLAQATLATVKEGRRVKDEITLYVKGVSQIDLLIDNSTSPKTLDTIDYFQVSDKEFRLNIDFVNPLKFRITAQNTEVDDELYKASNEYLSQAISLFQQVGAVKPAAGGARVSLKGGGIYEFTDPAIAELYILLRVWDKNFFNTRKPMLQAMQELVFEATKESVQEEINKTFKALLNITELQKIQATLESNTNLWEGVEKSIKQLETRFENLKNLVAQDTMNVNLKSVAQFRVTAVGKEIASFKKTIMEVKTKYDAVGKLFKDVSENTATGNKFLLTSIKKLKTSKRNELKITVQKVDFNMEDKTIKLSEKKVYLLHVRKYQFLIPVVSTGVMYSTLAFKQFGTQDDGTGQLIVTEGKEETNEIITGGFLNLFINRDSDYLPFFQFGVGPSKEKPILLFGGGMSLNNKINISMGAVFSWFPELDGLKVGDAVTGTSDISNATVYKFDATPKFYIGLNVNLSK